MGRACVSGDFIELSCYDCLVYPQTPFKLRVDTNHEYYVLVVLAPCSESINVKGAEVSIACLNH